MGEIYLSGEIKKKGARWWAYCDQYPLAAHGATQQDALANMMKIVDEYLEAAQAAKPESSPSRKKRGALTFQLQAA